MTIRMLETKPPFAEIDLARDSGFYHPLKRPIDGRATDLVVLSPDQTDQIIGAQVSLLAKEHVDDKLALGGPPATGRSETLNVVLLRFHLS